MKFPESRTNMDSTRNKSDEHFMRLALKEAEKAFMEGEVPVGCVIIHEGKVIARGHNRREKTGSVLSHAETEAIAKACRKIGDWRLDGYDVYVTLEPCPMCAGAMILSRIRKVVYGAREPKFGAHLSQTALFDQPFNHKVEVISGVLAEESETMLKRFFQELRGQKQL